MEKIDERHPSETFLRSIDVHTLLPQQEPFVMIGTLVGFDASTVVTETTIKEDNLLADDGVFTTAGMTENIAQTCAARIGYYNKYILRKGVQIGVIGAVRKMHVAGHPHVGDTIRTTVSVVQELLGMTLADATVTLNGHVIVTAQIKLAVKDQ